MDKVTTGRWRDSARVAEWVLQFVKKTLKIFATVTIITIA